MPAFQTLAELQGHSQPVTRVRWRGDGARIASCSYDRTVAVWDPKRPGAPQCRLQHSAQVWDVTWSPQGDRIAAGCSNGDIVVWDLSQPTSSRIALVTVHRSHVYAIAWSPSGQALATGGNDRSLHILDPATLADLYDPITLPGMPWAVCWSPSEHEVWAGCSDRRLVQIQRDQLRRRGSLDAPREPPLRHLEHCHRVHSLALLPSGALVGGAEDGTIRVWATPDAEPVTFQGHRHWVVALSPVKQGRFFASLGRDAVARLWRAPTWQLALEIPNIATGQYRDVAALDFDPCGQKLAIVGSNPRVVRVIDIDLPNLEKPACTVPMLDDQPCGRDPYPAPSPTTNACVMHSSEKNEDDFNRAIDNMLRHSESLRIYDCSAFVFPRLSLPSRIFEQELLLSDCSIGGHADFSGCRFLGPVTIRSTTLSSASFAGAVFEHDFNVEGDTSFSLHVDFGGAEFRAATRFTKVEFQFGATFQSARFRGPVVLRDVRCRTLADFSGARFSSEVTFERVGLEHGMFEAADSCMLDLTDVIFERPDLIRLNRINAAAGAPGLWLKALNCNLEKVHIEDVHWRRHRGRLTLHDEVDLPRWALGGRSSHELVAVVYRRLVTALDGARAVDLAEECFAGAMRMELRDPGRSLFTRAIIGGYWLASEFGINYLRAFGLLLFLVFAAFPGAFVASGRDFAYTRPGALFSSVVDGVAGVDGDVKTLNERPLGRGALDAVAYSVEIATFQRDPMLRPINSAAHALRAAEGILVPAQFTLALLALRRRFRR